MKNTIKMSLVAAIAVAGLSTTASANALENSIKGVDFSGNLRYRLSNYTDNTAGSIDTNSYRLEMKVKAPVNDQVTAVVATESNNNTTDATGDADPVGATIAEANFQFKLGAATVIAGKQGLVTPFADSSLDSQQGTGVVGLMPVGPVTLAAGFYLNSDAKTNVYKYDLDSDGTQDSIGLGSNNIGAVAVIGTFGPVNAAVWYANIQEGNLGTANTVSNGAVSINGAAAGADAVNVNLSGKFGPVAVEANYAKVSYSLNAVAKTSYKELSPMQARLVASYDAGIAKVTGGVVVAGKDGGDVTLGDGDAQSNFSIEAFTATALKDTTAYYAAVAAPVGPVNVKLEYGATSDVDGSATAPGDVAFNETKFSVAYPMSKNFTISGWVTTTGGDKVVGGTDYSKLGANRLEIKYTF